MLVDRIVELSLYAEASKFATIDTIEMIPYLTNERTIRY
jgi:hypothetical protein